MSKKITYLLFISSFVFLLGTFYALAQDSGGTSLPPGVGTGPGTTVNPPTPTPPIPNTPPEANPLPKRSPLPPVKNNDGENTNTGDTTLGAPVPQGDNLNQNNEDQGLDQETQTTISDLKAQMETIKSKINDLRQVAIQKMNALKIKVQTQVNKVKAKTQGDIITGREEALGRFDTAIQRVEDLKIKVENQVTKIESQGTTITDDIKGLSVTAESKLNDARAKVVEINTILAKSTNQLSKDDKTKLTTLTNDTQTLIKDAQGTLNNEVVAIKKLLKISTPPAAENTSDTTPPTTTIPSPGTATSSSTN